MYSLSTSIYNDKALESLKRVVNGVLIGFDPYIPKRSNTFPMHFFFVISTIFLLFGIYESPYLIFSSQLEGLSFQTLIEV